MRNVGLSSIECGQYSNLSKRFSRLYRPMWQHVHVGLCRTVGRYHVDIVDRVKMVMESCWNGAI